MKRKSIIIALVMGLTFISLACGKSAAKKMSEDDKHKLWQAAMMSRDPTLLTEVGQKLEFIDSSGQPTPTFEQFTKDHYDWVVKSPAFVNENMDPEKAKAYAKSHMP